MARRPRSRPWIRLLVLALAIIGAYSGIAAASLTPKLGIDLAGGTQVVLAPKELASGQQPPKYILDEAVDILRNRVNGKGVSGATVTTQYPDIVVTVPGASRQSVLDNIGRTAQLYFRQVATGCSDGVGGSNCVVLDASLAPPVPAVTASAKPSASAGTTAPAAAPTGTAAPAGTAAPRGSSTPQVAPASASAAASPTATAHGRPLTQALAATPSPAATGAASVAAPAPASAAPAPAAAPTAAASPLPAPANNGAYGPLPTGTGPIHWTEAQARAALPALQCGNQTQRTRVADFAQDSWALACGTGKNGDDVKYLLQPAALSGTSVKTADAEPVTTSAGNTQIATGAWQVALSFKDSKFDAFTKQTAGGTLQGAIVLDGVVESAPTNQAEIPGDAQITGNFTQQTAQDLANVLKYGSLPVSFGDNPETEAVSPQLGKSSLNAGLLAGAIGLAIVIAYCFVYYRALGIVTIASLAVSGAMVYATTVILGSAIGFTLSLAGIAGFIVAVGVTADSFVVFYERVKDEVRAGRRPRSAVEEGWKAGRRTIISADAVSLLAAIVLYAVSIGDVRGFALTLGVSTALDLVTVFFFTKPLVTMLIQRPFFSTGRFSGLSSSLPQAPLRRRPAADAPPGGPARRPVTAGAGGPAVQDVEVPR